ncbi:MAG: zinc dependent phospholipase C family protein [Deltaproteobacteria bacterium]|nr:zinc dependent phospholipase C family protein [Deltaproteobacteria bacterium]
MSLFARVLVAVPLLLVPSAALAFGPAAHVDMGLDALAGAAALVPGLAALLKAHRDVFLRGTLGPDREVAKNLASYARHSHNWQRAFRQLRAADHDAQRAFFLGCLCHLAADVVAHNYFVPVKLVESHRSRFAGHLYWEMRFDARTDRGRRDCALKSLGIDSREHRRFLATVVPGNLLGPRFNVRVTGLAMRLQRAVAFRKVGAIVDRESRLLLRDEDGADVRALAVAAQVEVLVRLERSSLPILDARGADALRTATRLRRQLRDRVRRQGEPNLQAAATAAAFRDRQRALLVAVIGEAAG